MNAIILLGENLYLIAMIDDATSRLFARFCATHHTLLIVRDELRPAIP